MPTIVLQVGQAGNQVGSAFWSAARTGGEGSGEFFDCTDAPRAVLVDTEPKAINSSSALVCPAAPQCVLGQGGRCNNWAYGYTAGTDRAARSSGHAFCGPDAFDAGGDADAAAVMGACRRHAERLDGVPDFLLLHSLGGGTGSGLGSRVLEQLRHDYRAAYVAAACIAPSASGDTTLQSINSTMALSFIQAYADVAMVFSNDDLLAALQPAQLSAARRTTISAAPAAASRGGARGGAASAGVGGPRAVAGGRTPGLKEMNELVARRLMGALWPLAGAEVLGGASRIRDIVQMVTPHHSMKFVEVGSCTAPATTPVTSLWADSLKLLGRAFPRYLVLTGGGQPQPVTAGGTLLLARGFQEAAIPDPGAAVRAAEAKLFPPPAALVSPAGGLPNVTLRWASASTPAALTGSTWAGQPGRASLPTLTAVSNRSSIVPLLDRTVDRCVALCTSGAYMHWYERYGCSKDAVLEAAAAVADVADGYRHILGLPRDLGS